MNHPLRLLHGQLLFPLPSLNLHPEENGQSELRLFTSRGNVFLRSGTSNAGDFGPCDLTLTLLRRLGINYGNPAATPQRPKPPACLRSPGGLLNGRFKRHLNRRDTTARQKKKASLPQEALLLDSPTSRPSHRTAPELPQEA